MKILEPIKSFLTWKSNWPRQNTILSQRKHQHTKLWSKENETTIFSIYKELKKNLLSLKVLNINLHNKMLFYVCETWELHIFKRPLDIRKPEWLIFFHISFVPIQYPI